MKLGVSKFQIMHIVSQVQALSRSRVDEFVLRNQDYYLLLSLRYESSSSCFRRRSEDGRGCRTRRRTTSQIQN